MRMHIIEVFEGSGPLRQHRLHVGEVCSAVIVALERVDEAFGDAIARRAPNPGLSLWRVSHPSPTGDVRPAIGAQERQPSPRLCVSCYT